MNKPFSEIVHAAGTYYIAGRIGVDERTGRVPEAAGDEIRLLMNGLRDLLQSHDLAMSDLVQVTVYTPDVSLFETFNAVYLTYFDGRLPARAFLGSGPLLFGARFELTAVAVKER